MLPQGLRPPPRATFAPHRVGEAFGGQIIELDVPSGHRESAMPWASPKLDEILLRIHHNGRNFRLRRWFAGQVLYLTIAGGQLGQVDRQQG